jgi:hypothetical protein
MTRPLLPPSGVFVPTHLIYDYSLSPVLSQTWVQLRGLAWGRDVTPSMLVTEMATIFGKAPSTLYRHLSPLRTLTVLSWRTTESGKIIVSFPRLTEPASVNDDSASLQGNYPLIILNSKNRELVTPPSLNPPINMDTLQIPVIEPGYQEYEQNPVEEGEGWGKRECEGERGDPVVQNCKNQDSRIPVILYRSVAHLMPNKTQQRIIVSTVTNLPLWQQTLEHWLGHGWNPKNITGMLQLYERGGVSGCRACRSEALLGHQRKTTHQQTLDAFESLRKKRTNPLNQD